MYDLIALQKQIFFNRCRVLILYVVLGSAFGGVVRYLIITEISRVFGDVFPWSTLAVNLTGSFLLGLIIGAISTQFLSSPAYYLGVVGFSGGLTTFSSFSLQNLSLASQRRWWAVAWNILGSMSLCMICIIGGYLIGEGTLL